MQNFISAPHRGGPGVPSGSPNAALLIDFDNVTMGIRSDLTHQLKDLLNSDIIRGKVAVQRAYADWRRYAQYIVPLSEASVDLIFAPAYGSSKKNATDIRLAIDALELVFTRPEIGVYILLSGDSDFSSLVLKLKEYGKYVIGVGLRESASDLLVQNCDEYYSYSSLTGLTKAGEEDTVSEVDPWELAERAVRQMADDNDVMRSDRLKQVMLEMDPNFDESKIGYSKFNKFLVEAASKNRLVLRKLDNGQYEVQPLENGGSDARSDSRRGGRGRRDRRDEPRPQPQRQEAPAPTPRPEPRQPSRSTSQPQPSSRSRGERTPAEKPTPRPATRERRAESLDKGYALLQQAVGQLIDEPGGAARDSDIKRQMLEIQAGWDESELGFTKFSRFLRQAHDAEVIDLARSSEGFYEARLPRDAAPPAPPAPRAEPPAPEARKPAEERKPEPKAEERKPAEPRAQERPEREPARREPDQEPAAEASSERDQGGSPMRRSAPDRGQGRGRPARESQATKPAPESRTEAPARDRDEERAERVSRPATQATSPADKAEEKADRPAEKAPETKAAESKAAESKAPARTGRSVGGRRGRRGGAPDGPPPVLPGQVVGGGGNGAASAKPAEKPAEEAVADKADGPAEPAVKKPAAEKPAAKPAAKAAPPAEKPAAEKAVETPAAAKESAEAPATEPAVSASASGDDFDPDGIGLPTDHGAVIRYLSNSYQGVGQKTAEALINAFGADRVFNGLNSNPEKVKEILGSGRRTEALLNAWQRDYRRRTAGGAGGSPDA